MSQIEQFAKQILANEMDRGEALRCFDSLSEEEQQALISRLNRDLPRAVVDGLRPSVVEPRALKPLDQRDMDASHREFIRQLTEDYGNFVPKSKANILKYQKHFVDQRRPFHLIKDLKNLHFQISYEKAEGAYIHDVDGNRYVDISGDMGVNIFGHKPPFIVDAVKNALDQGIPLAGYSETIFKAAEIFCDLTGHERMVFTQSGTESVMFAVRVARAATGRRKIVLFEGSFHGLSDAVVAMRDLDGRSLSTGPGMLQEFADQIIVLEYGSPEALDVIESRAGEIAGVLVEPVQSRHPYLKPVEFLKDLRKLTLELDIPLIVDEMITGFRTCPRGAQGLFGIQGDLATYGKIPGGGMPTGILAGSAKYMDLIDGGTWNFGDDSMPKSKRTGMAGTHTQNPAKIASVHATLSEIRRRRSEPGDCATCTCFQKDLTASTRELAEELNSFFKSRHLPVTIDHFASLFRFRFLGSYWGVTEALFFILLRMRGVETNIQGNCFLTTAHGKPELDLVKQAIKDSLDQLIEARFFVPSEAKDPDPTIEAPMASTPAVATMEPIPASNPADPSLDGLREWVKRDLQSFVKGGN